MGRPVQEDGSTARVVEVLRGWRRRPSEAVVDIVPALLAVGAVGTVAGELGPAVERVWLSDASGGGRCGLPSWTVSRSCRHICRSGGRG